MMARLQHLLTHPALALILRLYLAGIFIYASLHKINFPAEFADNIAGYLIVPHWLVNPLAVFMPWLELVSGLFLLAGVRVRAASLVIGGMLVMFTVAVIVALVQDTPIDCGCFQSVGEAISWWTVLRDLAWLAMAAHIYFYDRLVHLDRLFMLKPEELGL
ncbi:MAG: MauE/DoxX family redox-associated membrane protein [Desulfomicrobium sp.]|nr:MauE/DoxX family redox-associated membrane protein [Desulfomicrobium sp.]